MDIELTKAVAVLRNDLLDAAAQATDQELKFAVGPIEMEFAVELRVDAKAKLGFKAWILGSAEVEAGGGRTKTHTVKITLTPKGPNNQDLLISTGPGQELRPGDTSEHQGR